MLSKLLKHEFRATSRIMLPLYCAMAALAVFANLSTRLMSRPRNVAINAFSSLMLVLFILAVIAVSLMSMVLMIYRFYKNLMTDEGYLMFTLPVSTDQLILSKVITSITWFIATIAADILAVLIMLFRVEGVKQTFAFIRSAFRQMMELNGNQAELVRQGILVMLQLALLALLGMCAFCLLVYAAMAVGHSFSNHKLLLSFVFYFAFWTASQMITLLLGFWISPWFDTALTQHLHSVLWLAALGVTLYGGIFYLLTRWMLKKRLNLQ